jgi:hypothetical protein
LAQLFGSGTQGQSGYNPGLLGSGSVLRNLLGGGTPTPTTPAGGGGTGGGTNQGTNYGPTPNGGNIDQNTGGQGIDYGPTPNGGNLDNGGAEYVPPVYDPGAAPDWSASQSYD